MTQTTDTAGLTPEQRAEYLALLTPENLSALMRSTWTWDDRALRRTLSDLIVDLSAVAELRRGDVVCTDAVIAMKCLLEPDATPQSVAQALRQRRYDLAFDPDMVRMPLVQIRSLIEIGTP